ncbi:MAG: hypothetical protein A4E60_01704 [Syntrophorhabdus sp. PtaB.Bin047]|jgi:hypothetical protein|nr:MAG: hypothetical protein A4E60_01704 [Syntrophorhabdus sp. PtaB.Bin047]
MAKYDVTFSCGHTGEVTLFGPHRGREERIQWLEDEGDCPDCLAEKRRRLARETEKACTELHPRLAALSGTDRQIAWAQTLRAKILIELDQDKDYMVGRLRTGANEAYRGDGALQGWQQFIDDLTKKTSASWWIDHRSSPRAIFSEWATARGV